MARLIRDAEALGSEQWVRELVMLVEAWFSRPELGSYVCASCGKPATWLCSLCRSCLATEEVGTVRDPAPVGVTP